MVTRTHHGPVLIGTAAERIAYATGGLLAGQIWVEADTFGVYIWDSVKWLGAGGGTTHVTITDVDDPYSAGDEGVIICDATGGAITVDLPAVAGNTNKVYTIKRIDASAEIVTVDASGVETIDDETTQVLNQYDAMKIMCDGSEWWII